MSSRFVPSLRQLESATKHLPDPSIWPDEVFLVPLRSGETQRTLTFRKVVYNVRGSTTTHRWLYEGKVMMHHYDAGGL